ncbi:ANTAR domain-containing protein [Streptomyces minutiscleroticus]|uniref:ANTAR domain-containing protein n=1 Tax=Streptomyces minutiscleroticus TaxID=68238 RepID=A0A918KTK7_9ACTN|nr:ANTAR domain-containing protein [Streptomyces minutiscleroticus]GGX73051.1 hypothetical protein GCM10010358_29300 [Streptomyces minutiscleroticus]
MAFFAHSEYEPLRLKSVTDLVREVERLSVENAQLQRAVTSHAQVDQAIGALVVLAEISPADAWDVLRDVSQRTNTKLHTIAGLVLEFAQGCPLPGTVREALRDALARRRPSPAAVH